MNIAVIGAGAVGVSAALELARRDTDVVVYERGDIAAGASGRAAGICYDAFADRRDAQLARRSLDLFRERSGSGFRFTDCPYVWLARAGDARRATIIREHVSRMRAHGLNVNLLDCDGLADRYPALVTHDIRVAAVAEAAGYADPSAYTCETAERAREAGAEIWEDTPVELAGGGRTLRTSDGSRQFDAVLVAAGAHTGSLLSDVALPVAVKPYRVQALITKPVNDTVPMLYDATGGYYLRPRDGGLLVGDGTEPIERNPDDWNRDADGWFVEACTGYERAALGTSLPVERAWAGLCTATPDGDPLAGQRAPGVFVATGWQGHGFMRAPAFGEQLAKQMLGEPWPAFDPTRFDDQSFEIVEGMRVENR